MKLEWRTDRPPEEKEQYLVTYTSGSLDICWWSDTDVYGRSGGRWHWTEALYCKVQAWMPLPKPYFDPLDNITNYIEDNCDKFSDELYNGLWDLIREAESVENS